ncbi:hypothetical protein T552_02927 [Pneumocystis carinii B80]|uniref:Uncharacterized protein n=1 Tax=Pneumocystis carinii (strain B80) TaxID=1408658 RepID=A0A0W4ZDI8_PNEC8|nr:hypothetical protein T552_02927 [Pneumocystis carinii B80]KTW26448.1 hypothetical protein T552_02927 [Pneumocystis carinii B80]
MGQKSKKTKTIHENRLSEKYIDSIFSEFPLNSNGKDKEEEILEAKVFGNNNSFNEELKSSLLNISDVDDSVSLDDKTVDFSLLQDHELFYVDTSISQKELPDSLDKIVALQIDEEKSAWEDSDDERLLISLASVGRLRKLRESEKDDIINGKEYNIRLRKQFERINPVPEWAVLSKSLNDGNLKQNGDINDDDSDNPYFLNDASISKKSLRSLLESSEGYIRKTLSVLPPTTINIKRLKDANFCSPSESAILSLSFHPFYPLLLSGGHDRILKLFHIDKDVNPLVSSLYLHSSSIQTATFHPNSNKIIVGGQRKYFYIWDLESGNISKVSRTYGHDDIQTSMEKISVSPCGNFIGIVGNKGWFNILSAGTGQWITGFKIEGEISDVSWLRSGEGICVSNRYGGIWEWNILSQKVISKWNNESCYGITKLSLGGFDDRWFAVGSNIGIVNVYDRRNLSGELNNPSLYKTLDNLTTPINTLEFSSDGQILAMASKEKRDSLRLVHFPTGSVYKNWPTGSTPLGNVTVTKFSPSGSEIAIGNKGGKIGLWHFAYYS